VSRQAHSLGARLSGILLDTLPAGHVSDPAFDFGVHESEIDLLAELSQQDPARRAGLDRAVIELMANFAAHSRNLVRGVLATGALPLDTRRQGK
jgi:hypothetical protein